MRFYKLKYFEDENQDNPSIQEFRDGYDSNVEGSATHIRYYDKINFIPDLDFVLDSKGKATDLLEVCYVYSNYLCITPKFYTLLKEYRLFNYQHFDAIVRDKVNLLPYHFLHFYDRFDEDENNLVDFEKTKFYAEKTSYPVSIMATPIEEEGVLGEIQVTSWDEFHKLREKIENDSAHKLIFPLKTLYIKQKEFIELDLFILGFKNHGLDDFVVSERLAKKINANAITGVKIEPLPFEIEVSEMK